MRISLMFTFVLFVLWGNAQVKIDIPEPFGENFIESELIQEVSFVPLQLEKFGMIFQDMELKSDGNEYFILDHRNTQCVYRFNSEGKMLNSICETVSTTENSKLPVLSNPAKFSINPYKKQIEIFNFENSRINRYAYDGTSAGKVQVDITPSDFVRDSKGNYWIYTGWNNKQSQFRLHKLDQNGKTIDRKMRLVSKCVPFEGFSFYATQNGIYFWEFLGNSTYFISDNEITETYRFDYSARNLTPAFHQSDPYEALKSLNNDGFYSIKKYLENENYAYFFLNYTSNVQKEMFHVIYQKDNQKVFVYTEKSSIGAFDKAQYLTADNELIFLVSPRKMKQLLRMESEFIPTPFVSLDEQIGEQRDPLILKIKLGEQEYDNSFDEQFVDPGTD